MAAKFIMLGSGGWIPTRRRETTCALLSSADALFIFDAGTGLSRLLEPRFKEELKAEREIHLFLSHYHLDHIAGLLYLPAIFYGKTVHLHAADREISGDDPLEILSALIRKPFNPHTLTEMPLDVRVEPLREGEHDIAGSRVSVRKQKHADPSVGYRVDDLLVFATDTTEDKKTAEFASGARLLVHEAWIDGSEEDDPATEQIARDAYAAHTSARQCADLAAAAGVEQLVLCHLIPVRPDEYHQGMLATAKKIFPATRILEDGESIEL